MPPHFLESEWRCWMQEAPKNPDGAFIGFVKTYAKKHGRNGY